MRAGLYRKTVAHGKEASLADLAAKTSSNKETRALYNPHFQANLLKAKIQHPPKITTNNFPDG